MQNEALINVSDVPCCPEIGEKPCCDRLQFTYRLNYPLGDLPVEIVVVAELERCPGPLSLGDVVYSTTLLPGEKVRLYTSTRNTRFTYDAESEVTYRHEQASEETYYMSAMDRFMSDLTSTQSGSGSAESESAFETEGSVSNWTDAIFGRPDAKVEGEFSAESSYDFMTELRRHAEGSHERSVQGTRAANSVAIGEVQSRTHAEGESESAYEASTRMIENRNECHAVTYFAHQLVKRQTTTFRIKAVLRRVVDPVGDASVQVKPLRPNTQVAVIPSGVLATNSNRLEVETTARTSAAAKQVNLVSTAAVGGAGLIGLKNASALSSVLRPTATAVRRPPISASDRQKALAKVDADLVKAGILEKIGGQVSSKLQAELEFSKTSCLPTQAIIVKGCLDECTTCEDSRIKSIALDVKRRDLENKLLERQIALLDKSQEYRCCPVAEAEPEDANG